MNYDEPEVSKLKQSVINLGLAKDEHSATNVLGIGAVILLLIALLIFLFANRGPAELPPDAPELQNPVVVMLFSNEA